MSVITRFARPLVVAAALCVVAVPATAAQAKVKRLVQINRCASTFADKDVNAPTATEETSALSMTCLINQARAVNHLPPLTQQFTTAPNGAGVYDQAPLYRSALAHAQASVAARSWTVTNGLVSHLDPGTPVPSDPVQLQQLANQQIDARIRGAGYCAGGGSYQDAEVTYSGGGTGATPRAAVNWWLSDPPHAAILLSPTLREFRIAIVHGNPFSDSDTPDAAAFVMDLGSCG